MKPAQASHTAKVIAASTILLAGDPLTASLVAPGAATLSKHFLSGNRADRWLVRSAEIPLTRWLWRRLEAFTLPGVMAHFWYRKRWIERHCRGAIGEGFERIVVLGAGFDTLGFRLAREFREMEVIEIDHPATQVAKQRGLDKASSLQPGNLRYVPLDLGAEPLPMSLLDNGISTVLIIEGVLMYLSPADIDRLFRALSRITGPRLRLIFSFMTRWPDGRSGFRPYSWLIERWLAWQSEPFAWSIEPRAMPGFLGSHRFRLLEMALTREFSAPARQQALMLEGENLVICEPA